MQALKHPIAITALALVLALPCPAFAAEEDLQAWTAATATIGTGGRTVVWMEAQLRLRDEGARVGQVLLRPAVGYRLGATETAFLGYAYVQTAVADGPDTREHRVWQQLSFRALGDGAGPTITGRTRLEQRMVEGADDVGLRLRQMVRITAPLSGRARAVGWAEGFAGLGATTWGQPAGFDRLRTFAGIALPLGKGASLEPGYMNEWIARKGADRVNHIASLTINSTF
jgi:hypothetical protein